MMSFILKIKGDLGVRFIRNPNKEEFESGKYLIYTNTAPAYNPNDFVPVPVKAGLYWCICIFYKFPKQIINV